MQQQPDIWPVKADQGQLEQVIMNLAVNAQDAMPDGGTLTITTQNVEITSVIQRDGVRLPEGQYVNIRVSDTGTGMPEHVRVKVFEPFFTTKGIGKGTGLGLSTVYGIIKQTGGFVFVDSAEGEGTTFDIFLPHTPQSKEEQNDADQPVEVKRDLTGQGTILLVEDEDSVRAFASRALETRGYKVLAVECGARALEVLKEIDFNVDLMVSDVVMPEMDGPTLMHKVREIRPDMKVIFMSGYAEEAFRKNLNLDEKYGFIPKPFSLKQLATVVKDTLSE
jgi:two-component system cell cycle sensor histidine kinase/response regulator CckA